MLVLMTTQLLINHVHQLNIYSRMMTQDVSLPLKKVEENAEFSGFSSLSRRKIRTIKRGFAKEGMGWDQVHVREIKCTSKALLKHGRVSTYF
jgi:hypothetical protein